MGCRKSKQIEPGKVIVQGPPLNPRDIYRLKNSWKAIQREIEETGNVMFIKYFPSDSKLKKLFWKLTKVDDEEKMTMVLQAHANVTMAILDTCITHMDDANYVSSLLSATRLIHIKYAGFTHIYFWKLKEPFLEAVSLILQDRYTESIQRIYIIVINYILMSLSGGLLDDDISWDYETIRQEILSSSSKTNVTDLSFLAKENLLLNVSRTKHESSKLTQYGIPQK
ncbi:uncharacterized protein LOC121371423 [Gigantopelta aegis]|uniref:uncharacterized protein LOC121371423 n=1 Tax=Gigantopelta aegis TaxID=1735272 RepID=UPI001B8889ED|nr:uncharacterized protein LOC121371423 [Gigantopelta aegis]